MSIVELFSEAPRMSTAVDGTPLCLFWGQASPFSNWRAGKITLDGFDYSCGEQRMMHCKAALFGDLAASERVLASPSPWSQKQIGRSIRGYDEAVWEDDRMPMMIEIVFQKAIQDDSTRAHLMATGTAVIVEASPHDPVWGIGLSENDPASLDPSLWKGRNLLGRAWMAAREHIRAGTVPERSKSSLAIDAMHEPPAPSSAPKPAR